MLRKTYTYYYTLIKKKLLYNASILLYACGYFHRTKSEYLCNDNDNILVDEIQNKTLKMIILASRCIINFIETFPNKYVQF